MRRYFIKFSYIGTSYRGLQKNTLSETNIYIHDSDTIQGALESAFLSVRPKCIQVPKVTTSSRTDTGVHGLCNAAHIDLAVVDNKVYNPHFILQHVNRYLIKCCHNIRLLEFIPVRDDFHARAFAKHRTYIYRFMVPKKKNEHRMPISEMYHCLHFRPKIFDIERVCRGTQLFLGKKNFRTFSAKTVESKPIRYERKLHSFVVQKGQPFMPYDPLTKNFDFWDVVCCSKSFLYNQVRRMVGTLLALGAGIITERDINIMLQVPNHNNWHSGVTPVPGHGLYLANVQYDQDEINEYTIKYETSEDSNPFVRPIITSKYYLYECVYMTMDLNSLIKRKRLQLKSCKTVVTDILGQRYEEIDGQRKKLPSSTPFIIDTKPDLQIACIIPGLFLSSQDPVTCLEVLQRYEIHHVLSIGTDAPATFDGIKYYHYDLLDLPDSGLSSIITECVRIIHQNRDENILVHCNAGVSRSPAIVISYLMIYENLSYDDAYNKVKKVRNCIKPNEGFVMQLKTIKMLSIS